MSPGKGDIGAYDQPKIVKDENQHVDLDHFRVLDPGENEKKLIIKKFSQYQSVFALYNELKNRSSKVPLFQHKSLSYMLEENFIELPDPHSKENIENFSIRLLAIDFLEDYNNVKIEFSIIQDQKSTSEPKKLADFVLNRRNISAEKVVRYEILSNLTDDYEHTLVAKVIFYDHEDDDNDDEDDDEKNEKEIFYTSSACSLKGASIFGHYHQKLTRENSEDPHHLKSIYNKNFCEDLSKRRYCFNAEQPRYLTFELIPKQHSFPPIKSNTTRRSLQDITQCKPFDTQLNISNVNVAKLEISFTFLQSACPLVLDNFTCPFCDVESDNFHSFSVHLQLCHDRFSYQFEQEPYRVKVSLNDVQNISSEFDHSTHAINANTGREQNRVQKRKVESVLIASNEKRNQWYNINERNGEHIGSLKKHIIKDDFDLNNGRIYFHSQTCVPILRDEFEINSEDEEFAEWNKRRTIAMIDEFSDVNPGEKEIAKLWNLHVMDYCKIILGDVHIQNACEIFVEEHGREIVEKNLRLNLILHLCNLQAFGLIPACAVEQLSKKLNSIAAKLEGK